MTISVVTPAAQEPLSLGEVKSDRRIDAPDGDAGLSQKIAGARAECEAVTRLTLMTQTLRVTLDGFPAGAIALPVWPVQSIAQVRYVDGAGATQVLDPATYQLVASRKPNLLVPAVGAAWPETQAWYDSVLIDIVAGFGTASTDVPQDLINAMLMIIGARDEFREDLVAGVTLAAVPNGAWQLMLRHVFYG
jgi:uncharacterized phiE125 gp8 family phage protein